LNRLKDATSPYLLQHADNPVDWYPWGDEAFARARAEDKPILLSIGYSACHWCHVMAHESFEDPATAAIMNRDFVCIKVDREERPDVDDIYMQATLMFTRGHGGWPMTVFLTPDARPFHAGTYYPKAPRYGMPAFQQIMAGVIDAYRERRGQVDDLAGEVATDLQRIALGIGGEDAALTPALLDQAARVMTRNFDPRHGGLSRDKPKFPTPMNYEFLLRYHAHTADARALEVAAFSLKKMARGGVYDQIGGGFHRYSVDEEWLVPHFEKMLYDNSQLARLYLHAWQTTRDDFFRRVALEIYDYVLREMTAPEGGFYSTTDADSEGEEGKFFVWSAAELKALLTPDEARAAIAYWGVSAAGNFEGHNILHVPFEDEEVARLLETDPADLRALIESARDKLYAARTHRVHPGRDEKILTAWNGLMLASLAEGARVLGREDYLRAATRNAEFLLATLYDPATGRLLRAHKDGKTQINGLLEDYANLIDGLLQLYQAAFEPGYFAVAVKLADSVLAHFGAPDGGFFDTSDDHETLIARPRNLQDNALPSGNSMMARVLLQLAAYTGEARYEAAARAVLRQLSSALAQYPSAFGEALNALALLVYGIDEIALVGDPHAPAMQAFFELLSHKYRPGAVLAFSEADPDEGALPPLLVGRKQVGGAASAYVCHKFVCQRPVTTADDLAALIG
jgi:hypothetical protein